MDINKKIEKAYGKVFRCVMLAVNPLKQAVIPQPHCMIHQLINLQAVEILKNDNFYDAYSFFNDHIQVLNEGVVWADKDLKSSSHFYSPEKERGLYGNNSGLSLAVEYYNKALYDWKNKEIHESIFYLGAAVHIVQDMTVPQHANIRLLDNHRQYENYIRSCYHDSSMYLAERGGYYLENIQEFVHCNARTAIKIYSRLKNIKNVEKRYHTISKFTLPLAQKTTAGCLMRFYKDITKR